MKKFPVLHALTVVLMILTLSACAELDPSSETAVVPEAGILVDAILDSEAARNALLEELGQQLPEKPPVEASSPSPPLVSESLYVDLYQQVNPAVVNIQITKTLDEVVDEETSPQLPEMPSMPGFPFPGLPEMQPFPQQGQGSGFVYDSAGHIITNNHVIDQADKINVVFADGSEAEAVLIGADPDTDLAVIKVEDMAEDLVALTLADSDRLQVGQHVVAIGNPFGLSGSMTTGIISGLGRILPASASQFSIPDIIQTDAAINPGNSGGPLLNLDGQIIGVNTAIASSSRSFAGVGYAVPANIVLEVVPELITQGRVLHPWLGIAGRTLDRETAAAMNLEPSQRGILIAEVVAESPADESGLRGSDTQVEVDGQQISVGGDVIVGIDDQTVDDFDDLLSYIVNKTEVDQQVTLHLLRDGEPVEVEVVLAARPVQE